MTAGKWAYSARNGVQVSLSRYKSSEIALPLTLRCMLEVEDTH
jgi:hypothetical protein